MFLSEVPDHLHVSVLLLHQVYIERLDDVVQRRRRIHTPTENIYNIYLSFYFLFLIKIIYDMGLIHIAIENTLSSFMMWSNVVEAYMPQLKTYIYFEFFYFI